MKCLNNLKINDESSSVFYLQLHVLNYKHCIFCFNLEIFSETGRIIEAFDIAHCTNIISV